MLKWLLLWESSRELQLWLTTFFVSFAFNRLLNLCQKWNPSKKEQNLKFDSDSRPVSTSNVLWYENWPTVWTRQLKERRSPRRAQNWNLQIEAGPNDFQFPLPAASTSFGSFCFPPTFPDLRESEVEIRSFLEKKSTNSFSDWQTSHFTVWIHRRPPVAAALWIN